MPYMKSKTYNKAILKHVVNRNERTAHPVRLYTEMELIISGKIYLVQSGIVVLFLSRCQIRFYKPSTKTQKTMYYHWEMLHFHDWCHLPNVDDIQFT